MHAIVEIGGKQYSVKAHQSIYTSHLAISPGHTITLDKILLIEKDNEVKIGTPMLSGAKITGKIIEHVRGKKIKVFKKHRRKGYKKMRGHRQDHTKIQIEQIHY